MCSNKVSTLLLLSNGIRSIFDVLISLTGRTLHSFGTVQLLWLGDKGRVVLYVSSNEKFLIISEF